MFSLQSVNLLFKLDHSHLILSKLTVKKCQFFSFIEFSAQFKVFLSESFFKSVYFELCSFEFFTVLTFHRFYVFIKLNNLVCISVSLCFEIIYVSNAITHVDQFPFILILQLSNLDSVFIIHFYYHSFMWPDCIFYLCFHLKINVSNPFILDPQFVQFTVFSHQVLFIKSQSLYNIFVISTGNLFF